MRPSGTGDELRREGTWVNSSSQGNHGRRPERVRAPGKEWHTRWSATMEEPWAVRSTGHEGYIKGRTTDESCPQRMERMEGYTKGRTTDESCPPRRARIEQGYTKGRTTEESGPPRRERIEGYTKGRTTEESCDRGRIAPECYAREFATEKHLVNGSATKAPATSARDGSFVVGELLGRGGSGQVYRVTDKNGIDYALKLVTATRKESLQKLQAEVALLRQLSSGRSCLHDEPTGQEEPDKKSTGTSSSGSIQGPRRAGLRYSTGCPVVHCYDTRIDWAQLQMYFLMELADCDFDTLHKQFFSERRKQDLVAERCASHSTPGPEMGEGMPFEMIGQYWGQMIDAVEYVHAQNIIHFDLKPANFLLFEKKQRVKLADFGLARMLCEDQTHISRHGQCGTFLYMAPEAFYQGDQYEQSMKLRFGVDIWSLGIILYAMLYERPPHVCLLKDRNTGKPVPCGMNRVMCAILDPCMEIQYPAQKHFFDVPVSSKVSSPASEAEAQNSSARTALLTETSEREVTLPEMELAEDRSSSSSACPPCRAPREDVARQEHLMYLLQSCLERDLEQRIDTISLQDESCALFSFDWRGLAVKDPMCSGPPLLSFQRAKTRPLPGSFVTLLHRPQHSSKSALSTLPSENCTTTQTLSNDGLQSSASAASSLASHTTTCRATPMNAATQYRDACFSEVIAFSASEVTFQLKNPDNEQWGRTLNGKVQRILQKMQEDDARESGFFMKDGETVPDLLESKLVHQKNFAEVPGRAASVLPLVADDAVLSGGTTCKVSGDIINLPATGLDDHDVARGPDEFPDT
ncbi:unnamed protein product, partial [Amoebophrya sp. A120]|eukprot:GSA120T00012265001.1